MPPPFVPALVSPQAANIERAGFAVLGVVIKAIDDGGTAAGANGLNVSLDAQLIADVKASAAAVKGALPALAYRQASRGQRCDTHSPGQIRHSVKSSGRTPTMS